MDDNDKKKRAAPKVLAVKPGAFAEDGGVDVTTEQLSTDVETTTNPPESMCQAERDILAKQHALNATTDEQMKPGAVAVGGVEKSHTSVPGVVHEAPNSRLLGKLRGELPESWNSTAPAVATLESRENQIQNKLRENEPVVSSTLIDRENKVQSKIRASEPPVNSNLLNREDQIQSKIRSEEPAASMPGALAKLSTLQDAVTSKQGAGQDLLSLSASPPMQLQHREDIAASKSDQISRNLDEAPQRLQHVEMMLDRKMRDGTADDIARSAKIARHDEMEYGEYGGPNETDLAVALAVDEDDGEGAYLPAAVEYDPDAKPPLYRSYRFRLYTCLALIAVLIGIIGAVVGIVLTRDDEELQPINIQYRETLGIRENIELFVSNDKLDDPSSPYRKALDWIIFEDPMILTPAHNHLAQRYIVAYFFYATSAKKPWASGCNPPKEGEKDECTNKYFFPDSGAFDTSAAKRWLSNSSECEWAGVICDDLFQIREMDISGSELSGTFPEGLMLLPFIQEIKLAHGELEGTLPDYLPDAKHLIHIDLRNNSFTGTFPDRWLESRSFQHISLSDNNISGTITTDIAKLIDLKDFSLERNSLEGTIPREFGDLLNLNRLELEQNRLLGSLPTELGLLTRLEYIHLGRNKLTGTIPTEIGFINRLFSARLQVNSLSGPVPEEFWNLDQYGFIDLSFNRFNGTVSDALGRMSTLFELVLNDNQFSGTLPDRIAAIDTGLVKIVATGNNLNGTVSEVLCEQKFNNKALKIFELDCKAPVSGGAPEITCPEECCTLCCDPDGKDCVDV